MENNILEIHNLKKIYHNRNNEILAIDNLNLKVKPKEIIAIVGPSGCGKSTLLSILAGLEKESDGKIILLDNLKIGYMLQTDSLFPWRTILDNCLIGLEITNTKNSKNQKKVEELLDKYGLNSFKNQYPNTLSGGMKQRVALIRTLALNPDILLLDEPYSALDYQTRLQMVDDLDKMLKNEQKTVILITHDIAEAISLATRIIVLTKRPCHVKKEYNINFEKNISPSIKRKLPEFNKYYEQIWRDLDVNL